MLEPEIVGDIFKDAHWYEVLWMRWTVVYWCLTLLASGTAVAAAVRNAYNARQPAPDPKTGPKTLDNWVMVLAALTVVATVLMGAMRPDQQAERYRLGDLMLQDATFDYKASQKTDADVKTLVANWHQAQQVLKGGVGLIQPSPTVPQHESKPSTASAPPSKMP